MLKTAVRQAAVQHMSGNRVQTRSLPRRKVQGASLDLARNVLTYGSATSRYLAKLTYLPKIRDDLTAMRSIAKDRQFDEGASLRNRHLEELQSRINANVIDAKAPNQFVSDVLALSYLSKLGSLGHSIVNFTQVGMVSYPTLAGEHGPVQTTRAIGRAYNDIGFGRVIGEGFTNTAQAFRWSRIKLDTTDIVGSIEKRLRGVKDGSDLLDVVRELKERGALDDGSNFELAKPIAAGRGQVGTALSKMDRIARQLPAAIEAINRTVTAVSAYRLAREKGFTHERAREYAFDTTMKTQGDYSAVNQPKFFNKEYLRPALQFKKYAQMMSYVMFDMTKRAFSGASKEERAVAQKQLAHLVGVQVLMAGALSLPGIELVKAASMLAAAFGFGSGWEDKERWLRKLADNALGKTWGELVSRGVLTRAAGVDLSSRVSLADLWLFGEPKEYSASGLFEYLGKQFLGAPGSTVNEAREALTHAGNGEWDKAAEKLVPIKAVADTIKGVNRYRGGQDNTQNLGEIGLNAIGLRSARQANHSEEIGERMDQYRQMQGERKRLSKAYLEARTPVERAKLVAQIQTFNKTAPVREKVFVKSLDKRRGENEQRARTIQGN
jgi:hypothetical protein